MAKKKVSNSKRVSPKSRKVSATAILNHPPKGMTKPEFKQEVENRLRNDLSQAVLGFGFNQFGGPTISSTDPQFDNLRWYLITNFRQLLSQMYVEHGIIRALVDVPVDDAFRGQISIKTKLISEEEISELHFDMQQNDDIAHLSEGKKWERLFGGGGLVIMTDQDPSTPLDIKALSEDSPLEFRPVDMWELFWAKQSTSDYDEMMDQAGDYLDNVEYYDYYGIKLHHSRVLVFTGLKAPSFIRPRLRGWGLSVVEALVRSFNQYLKAIDVTYEVLDEFKIDIYKIKNLANMILTDEGSKVIRRRVQIANMEKNYQNAITMDSEDEYDHKQLSFAGLAEVMTGVKMQIAADLRMPLTKIFGISSAGFSSGEDDIENYNGMIEGTIRTPAKKALLTIIGLRCQRKYGFIPSDLDAEYAALRILSAEQEENVKTQQFNRTLQSAQAGLIDGREWRDGVNHGRLLPVQLDSEKAMEIQKQAEPDGEGAKSEKSNGTAKKSVTAPKEAKE